jgi:RNase adaptor protein for sRNA GlmZ degradation
VRFLPNPHFEVGLREQTGRDAPVAEYVLKSTRGAAFFERLRDWLRFLLPLYDSEGKAYVTIGVGCTGGRHRSVAVAEALAVALRADEREGQRRAPRRGEERMKPGIVIVTHYRLGEEFLRRCG